jgi:hypothetical protein
VRHALNGPIPSCNGIAAVTTEDFHVSDRAVTSGRTPTWASRR